MKRQADSVRQGTLFEDDYLLRTLGTLGYKPEAALTELVANSWDAGASVVEMTIPEKTGEQLSVIDDGSGMTPELFRKRWMTLGYDRIRHQGSDAEFPPERAGWRRHAYGHNGVGRHGLLCFGREYEVETWRDGSGAKFKIGTSAGDQPFRILSEKPTKRAGHGTALYVTVQQRLPDPDRILAILAARCTTLSSKFTSTARPFRFQNIPGSSKNGGSRSRQPSVYVHTSSTRPSQGALRNTKVSHSG